MANCSRVRKLDCVGHVQKRMGNSFERTEKRSTKLKDGKSVKGSKHRLTDKAIDKLQTYYGNDIRANVKPGKLTSQQEKDQVSVMQKNNNGSPFTPGILHAKSVISPVLKYSGCSTKSIR